ncbi:hypothetical protein CLOP_g23891 [Closterium sp. NIES-67]|nr:hypothetical protein CLOP_g23891 [Closterium sp. NIES-67]
MTNFGRVRGGIPGRHPHLLVRHEAARRTPATRLLNSLTRRFYVTLSKSEFSIEKVQFLGHMVSAQGVHVDPKKVEAVYVEDTREREGVAAVPRLRELLQQVRATVCETRSTTHESAEEETRTTNGKPKHKEVVEQLKQALTSAPVLILPNRS